jgi:CubicO group peptidase (beta-lactamase class C family)
VGFCVLAGRTCPVRRLSIAVLTVIVVTIGFSHSTFTLQASASSHTPAFVAKTTKGLSARLDGVLNAATRKKAFSGTVLVARHGTVVLSKGYSFADWRHHVRNTPTTQFHIQSLTKQFTAMAILILQERGKLSVREHMCTYIKACPSNWKPITIQELLSQSSGLPEYVFVPPASEYSKPKTPEQLLGYVKGLPLDFSPGTQWEYSNTNYIPLGLIIEKVSGKSYGDFMAQNIFGPLGMTDTGLNHAGLRLPRQAVGYHRWRVEAQYVDPSWFYSQGGLYSTVGDLYKWDKGLNTEKLVSRKSLNQMFAPQVIRGSGAYGYGWYIDTINGHRVHWHEGGALGWASYNALYPDDQVTIVVLSNLATVDVVSLAEGLGRIVLSVK